MPSAMAHDPECVGRLDDPRTEVPVQFPKRRAEKLTVHDPQAPSDPAPSALRAPRIFAFVNGKWGSQDYSVTALSEDGHFLAGHICSLPAWGPHDMGANGASDWKHDVYAKHYPDGFEVVWVDEPKDDADVMAAYERHLARGGPDAG